MHEQRRPRHHRPRRAPRRCTVRRAAGAAPRESQFSEAREDRAHAFDHVRSERCVLRVHGAFPFGVLAVWSGNWVCFSCHPGQYGVLRALKAKVYCT